MGIVSNALAALGLAPAATVTGYASALAGPSHLAGIDPEAAELFLGIRAGGPMTRDRAIRLSVVARGRRRIAPTIGRLPLVATRAGRPLPQQPSLLAQPEPGRPRLHTITWTVDRLIFYPWCYWHVTARDARGFPSAVRLVPREEEQHDHAGRLVAIAGHPVRPADVIRIDGPDAGLLADGADVLRRAELIAAAAARAEANPVPALDLHNEGEDLTAEEVEALLASWERARARRGVGYSSRSLKVTPLGAATENLLIAGRRAVDLELARHMGLPAWAAEVPIEGSSMNYTNRASRNEELIDTALQPYMAAITARLSMDDVTPHGTDVAFDTDSLTLPARGERLAMLAGAVQSGILTVPEARAEEGYE